MYLARGGLGFLRMRWYTELQIPKMQSIVILIGGLAALLDYVFRLLESHAWLPHGFRQES